MNKVIDILKKVGAITTDSHFVGTSGFHFDTYINKDELFPHTQEASEIGKIFAEKYKDSLIDAVVAPALGGIILSQWTAYHLSKLTGREVFGVYTEKTADKEQVFTRGYDNYVKNKRVLVIEDITTTGKSVMKTVRAVKDVGGQVVEVCVMVNKDLERVNAETLGVPFNSLAEFPVVLYTAEDCPLCKSGVPVNITVGHGKQYLKSRGFSK
ncbi:MAG: phosphoribosyltransferase family protein [Patescibacteria group bacterium]